MRQRRRLRRCIFAFSHGNNIKTYSTSYRGVALYHFYAHNNKPIGRAAWTKCRDCCSNTYHMLAAAFCTNISMPKLPPIIFLFTVKEPYNGVFMLDLTFNSLYTQSLAPDFNYWSSLFIWTLCSPSHHLRWAFFFQSDSYQHCFGTGNRKKSPCLCATKASSSL